MRNSRSLVVMTEAEEEQAFGNNDDAGLFVQDSDEQEYMYQDESEQDEAEEEGELSPLLSGGRKNTRAPSAFMSRVLNDVEHDARPNMLSVLFENQLEISRGMRCVIRVPRRPTSPTRWGLVCPSMVTVDKATSAKSVQSSDPFSYFDGFDMYATELEARDTRFSDPLITRPNPVFDSALVEHTFVDRKVFSTVDSSIMRGRGRRTRGEAHGGDAEDEDEGEEENVVDGDKEEEGEEEAVEAVEAEEEEADEYD
jgi:hypothetical protein